MAETMTDALRRASEYNALDNEYLYWVATSGRVYRRREGTNRHYVVCSLCQLRACHPDQEGRSGMFCTRHARLAGSHTVKCPCRDCPVDDKKESKHPDELGNKYKLCASHAALVGSHIVRDPCRDCSDDDKRVSKYEDESGNKNRLCSHHAKEAGTWKPRRPCVSCHTVDTTKEHNFICAGCDPNRVRTLYQ
jgi:hypothetical protein